MAVYERSYRPYAGRLIPERERFLVFPRYAYQEIFKSKLFLAFFVLCFVYPFILACWLYLPHNLGFIKTFGLDPEEFKTFFKFPADWWYGWLMLGQSAPAFILTFIVGPALVSTDLRNNGLALYFSRPITRTEYVLGKVSVLVILLSAITWIPGLLLFLFQCYLGGFGWLRDNWRVGGAIVVGFWILILLLCLISLALSAYVKWRPVARILLLVLFFLVPAFSTMLNLAMRTYWADVLNLTEMLAGVWAGLFGVASTIRVPLWAAWGSLVAVCLFCLMLLSRKLRPYEVVR